MNLHEKILSIYPELANFDFASGVITLQNDSDGKGDYIASWSHPDFPQPTEQQLAEIK
jgi:hypothetical protein